MPLLDYWKRMGAACWWQVGNRAERNRACLYAGTYGVRILAFHAIPTRFFPTFQRIVEWCQARFVIASPADIDALSDGQYSSTSADRVLLTFDDGFDSQFAAARWLAACGIQAIFFIVPSLIDRSVREYLEYHRRRNVFAYALAPECEFDRKRGLSSAQIAEMCALGHRIGAHNFAHRDLGALHTDADVHYEIIEAVEWISDLIGHHCDDFAVAFGQPDNLSTASEKVLSKTCRRVYMCFRGLNVPGCSARYFLRHDARFDHPGLFTRACIDGSGDHYVFTKHRQLIRRVGRLFSAQPS